MNKHLRIFMFGLSVSGAAVVGAPRLALASADGLPTRIVSYADLDVTKPAGAKTLYRRITVAAQQVCTIPGYTSLGEQASERICMKKAIDAAVQDVQSAALADQHGQHSTRVARN